MNIRRRTDTLTRLSRQSYVLQVEGGPSMEILFLMPMTSTELMIYH